jgi:penicillin-binding protein 1A
MNKLLKKYIKIFLFLLGLGFGSGSMVILYFYYESYRKFPSLLSHIPNIQKSNEIIILDRNNKEIPYSFQNKKITVHYKAIPKLLVKTLINVEDKKFFSHKGINFISTFRSILLLPFFIITRKRPWGASTITQQLVRNLFLNQKYSYLRKVREIILSFRIEKELSKEQILSLYLNLIYFGKGIYGIGTASKVFFNKELHQLNAEEIAFLIGIIKNPSFALESNHDEAMGRRNFVLSIMAQNKIISQEYYDEIIANPIQYFNGGGNERVLVGRHFTDQVLENFKKFSENNPLDNENIMIKTTMDIRIQTIIQKVIKEEVERLNDNCHQWYGNLNIISEDKLEIMTHEEKIKFINRYKNSNYGANILVGLMVGKNEVLLNNGVIITLENYKKHKDHISLGAIFFVKKYQEKYYPYQKPLLEASAMVFNGKGEILGMVGSYDYQLSSFNRIIKTPIQLSSLMKILIYGFLLENNIDENTEVNDEPVTVNYDLQTWSPKNWDNKFMGPMTVGEGLILSRNASVVHSVLKVNDWYVKLKKYLKKFSIYNVVPSYIIGSNETTIDHFGIMMASIVNGGYKVEKPLLIKQIIQNNNIIFKDENILLKRILDENITNEIYNLFCKNNTEGLGKTVGIPLNFATKSGTANENKRINFIAFEKNGLIIIVTIAKDNNQPFKAVSNKAGQMVKKIIHHLNQEDLLKEYNNDEDNDSIFN